MLDMNTAMKLAEVTNGYTVGIVAMAAQARINADNRPATFFAASASILPLLGHAKRGAGSIIDLHSLHSYTLDPMHGDYLHPGGWDYALNLDRGEYVVTRGGCEVTAFDFERHAIEYVQDRERW